MTLYPAKRSINLLCVCIRQITAVVVQVFFDLVMQRVALLGRLGTELPLLCAIVYVRARHIGIRNHFRRNQTVFRSQGKKLCIRQITADRIIQNTLLIQFCCLLFFIAGCKTLIKLIPVSVG